MALKNQVQLITYPDSMGGDLTTLNQLLNSTFNNIFKGGVHILPPYPSSGDRGFAPLTYLEIEEKFGDWKDVKAIGEKHDVLLDLMVNHISQQSEFFQDFLEKGEASEYTDLFITIDKLWEDHKPNQADIDKMFLRRKVPYSTFKTGPDDKEQTVWTTFGRETPSEQIDLDVHSSVFKDLMKKFFENFSKNHVKIVRLDAIGYIIKKLGTSGFFVEPDIYDFLDWIKDLADAYDIALLPEVHSHYSIQYKLAERGFWIYDFILPYTVLDTLVNRNSKSLKTYLKDRPENQFTMLDCHDGVPVKPDMDDLIDTKEARKIVDHCLDNGANLSYILSDEHKAEDGFDVHQIRGSYYSLLNEDDDAYLAARAIQFFIPGIPQVYYMTLLAEGNDSAKVEETGEGREINRKNFSLAEIEEKADKEVVQRLLKLIQFRNDYPAFNGVFTVDASAEDQVKLSWKYGAHTCSLQIDLKDYTTQISYLDDEQHEKTWMI